MALSHPTVRDSYNMLRDTGVDGTPLDEADAAALRDSISQAAFSNTELSRDDYERVRALIKKLTAKIRRKKNR